MGKQGQVVQQLFQIIKSLSIPLSPRRELITSYRLRLSAQGKRAPATEDKHYVSAGGGEVQPMSLPVLAGAFSVLLLLLASSAVAFAAERVSSQKRKMRLVAKGEEEMHLQGRQSMGNKLDVTAETNNFPRFV